MQKKVIASPLAPKAVGPYSQAIAAGTTLYVSGQLPIDAATGLMAEGIEAQTQRALENISAILAEAGYALSDVVKTTVLLQDIGDFAAMNGVYATYFTGALPARVCYEVARLLRGGASVTRWRVCRWVRASRSTPWRSRLDESGLSGRGDSALRPLVRRRRTGGCIVCRRRAGRFIFGLEGLPVPIPKRDSSIRFGSYSGLSVRFCGFSLFS